MVKPAIERWSETYLAVVWRAVWRSAIDALIFGAVCFWLSAYSHDIQAYLNSRLRHNEPPITVCFRHHGDPHVDCWPAWSDVNPSSERI